MEDTMRLSSGELLRQIISYLDLPGRTRICCLREHDSKWIEVRANLEGVGLLARLGIRHHFETIRRNHRFKLLRMFTSYAVISDPGHPFGNRYREFCIKFEVKESEFPDFRVRERRQVFVENPVFWVRLDQVEDIREPPV
jgi:hypothetical protein